MYNLVCGLETHVELLTKTKLFCSCPTEFGQVPNSHCCAGCSAEPGIIPKTNKEAFVLAIRMGIATNCTINKNVHFERKNYVYPDLATAYQITQLEEPICINGHITLDSGKKIRINRIHIEEDAGKLVHEKNRLLMDNNRSSVPLIEIVTEPDISSVAEAREYLEKLQLITRHLSVSDAKMQEGSMRCDVNISVNRPGEPFGTRSEIKNMNSLSFIEKAIEYEYNRHIDAINNGEKLFQETRRFIESDGSTEAMRDKENAQDYRYFSDPDILAITISDAFIDNIRATLPELPMDVKKRYLELGLSVTDADLLIKYKNVSDFFSKAIVNSDAKIISTYILGTIFRNMQTEDEKEIFKLKITPSQITELANLQASKKISAHIARDILDKMLQTGKDAKTFLTEEDLAGVSEDDIKNLCCQAIENNPKAKEDYLNGKIQAIKSLIGYVMKLTKGKANPALTEEILLKLINE